MKNQSVPEFQLKSIQLAHGIKQYDDMGRELRHASKLWEYAAKCWHIDYSMQCNFKWNDNDKHICFWCPQHADVRNQEADINGIRWIPPKKHKVLR